MFSDDGRADNLEDIMLHVTNIVAAYVRNNSVPAQQLGAIIRLVYAALANVGSPEAASGNGGFQPAVPIRKSITPDYLVCLEDGRHLKMLKRYLRSHYKMTPDQYRAKWGLPADYPMVAPNYARQRSDFAIKNGLGRNNAV
jgi:predicted transcriptional regulator